MKSNVYSSAQSSAHAAQGSETRAGRPTPLKFGGARASGSLSRRLSRNFDRLESELYQPPQLFERMAGDPWPGDTEGRTLLALALLEHATGREACFSNTILEGFTTYTNADGYFGPIHLPKTINEQQLASHGWVLRGLCEHYRLHRDDFSKDSALRIIRNLALPTTGQHGDYPIEKLNLDKEDRKESGNIINDHDFGRWQISTDTACSFIFLDGLVQAHFLFQTGPDVRALIDEMVDRFLQIDLIEVRAQTHATLTGLRALLRLEANDPNPDLLAAVELRYKAYREQGMTEEFENYNWFGRPLWTEPCAIVDSLLVADQLWQATGKAQYLEDAQLIYYNGIAATQRSNGGFGCNTCVCEDNPILQTHAEEAYWCCTMRGAEGLVHALQCIAYSDRDAAYVTRPESGSFTLSEANWQLEFEIETSYPDTGDLTIRILDVSGAGKPQVKLFIPSWTELKGMRINGVEAVCAVATDGFLTLTHDWRAGDRIECQMAPQLATYPTHHAGNGSRHGTGWQTLRHGPLILCIEKHPEITPLQLSELKLVEDKGHLSYRAGSYTFEQVGHLMNPAFDTLNHAGRQVLFPKA